MNRHNQPLARCAVNEYGSQVKIVKWFKLSQKSMGLALIESMTV